MNNEFYYLFKVNDINEAKFFELLKLSIINH
jgi:hypothetical protein